MTLRLRSGLEHTFSNVPREDYDAFNEYCKKCKLPTEEEAPEEQEEDEPMLDDEDTDSEDEDYDPADECKSSMVQFCPLTWMKSNY